MVKMPNSNEREKEPFSVATDTIDKTWNDFCEAQRVIIVNAMAQQHGVYTPTDVKACGDVLVKWLKMIPDLIRNEPMLQDYATGSILVHSFLTSCVESLTLPGTASMMQSFHALEQSTRIVADKIILVGIQLEHEMQTSSKH